MGKMKALIGCVMVLASTSAWATSINFTTKSHGYTRFPDQMVGVISYHEALLNQYLGTVLECRLVNLKFNNMKNPGIFEDGRFRLTLTAACNKTFENFNMTMMYVTTNNGEPVGMKLTYVMNGVPVTKVIKSY